MNDIFSLIKVGIVDGINEQEGTIRVTFPDDDDKVVDDIALMSFEQKFPSVTESVLCVFLPNGTQQGFCLGAYFNDENLPPIPNKNMYVKKIDEGLTITYDYTSKKLTISTQNEVAINSNVSVNGNLTVSGTITN
ncbi:hypothetical protein V7127_02610 [Bacillus sp. JJ1773]|uniref:hypothetical protein n=1 Tax=Bacillus sp. JJ1773 TaxID=3122965 RepID=UPI002FFE6861